MHEPAAMSSSMPSRESSAARGPWWIAPRVACWVVALTLGGLPAVGMGQPANDDPFADELNPFGRGGDAKPVEKPSGTSDTPRRQPGDTDGGDRATPKASDLDPAARTPVAPKRAATEPSTESRERARLPVPFPESDEPEPRPRSRSDRSDAWQPTEAEELLAEAEKLDHAGKLEEARAKLREVIKLDPKMTLAYLALGVTSRRLGDFEGSVEACSQGLEIDPNDSELYLRRGIAWFHMGLYGIALEDFEDAAGIAYDDPRPELWRGLTLVELDRPLEAINAYASSIRRDRTFMLAYLNRGLAYLLTNEPRKAESDFNQAIRHDPRDARAWFNRGVAQTRQGRFREASHSYEEALKREPKFEAARQNAAAVKARVGEERRP
jgi:tetratricopeptide (TPR) repeat protein